MIAALCLLLSLCGCGGEEEKATTPPDLTGTWTQVGANAKDTYQEAVIEGETIEIYWVSDGGDTRSLYWAGTYAAPTTTDEPYSWDSENDHEKTGMSLLASGDDTKTITYEKGQLSYSASAFGSTTTVRLEPAKE